MNGDRILDIVAVVLALAVLAAVGTVVLAAVSAPGTGPSPPDANWTAERVNESHVRITHAGGEPVEREHLAVAVNGTERAAAWPDVIVEGDSGVVRARGGSVVELYWSTEHSRRSRITGWRL